MKYALGYAFLDGINVAISIVTLLHLFKSTGDKHTDELYSGIALLAFGVGCCFGAFFGGKLCDRMLVRTVAYLGHFAFGLTCILSLVVSLIDVFPFSCFVCCCWGYVLYHVQANEMVLCSKLFDGKYESFAVIKQFHCVSLMTYFFISMITDNSIPVYYLMVALLMLVFPSLYLTKKLPEEKRQVSSILTQEQGSLNEEDG